MTRDDIVGGGIELSVGQIIDLGEGDKRRVVRLISPDEAKRMVPGLVLAITRQAEESEMSAYFAEVEKIAN
ncbi:MAG: hypothetical protein A3I39_00690 [Candidatus Yanofskybacteria bacterium RIFCSPLOWO2_02_FULL_47_9b]|uniref:Uncharacterized protein n=1 Tax=Candidatus Yanofskybacteria bacterium RIFCSPLOWO2_02_FULL_47_9b TaxID=1802708 RepID=A0A1F8H7R7_9BACT|nr:MAG: hypothetical protein A3I39_00690 [Candidatus Yanofskybacteria bacterium RIFCSPLOWO2_02_FULL_47_9b]